MALFVVVVPRDTKRVAAVLKNESVLPLLSGMLYHLRKKELTCNTYFTHVHVYLYYLMHRRCAENVYKR